MPKTDQPAGPKTSADQLVRLAEMLRLDFAEEDLTALASQLRTIEALEETALQDFSPALKLDADWHD